ncbi:MAG: cell wall hydrolase [Novosphingobium sp.]|nr:cell wall hydrolase [Novosphingobium sp.]
MHFTRIPADDRPGDFSARFSRRARPLSARWRAKHRGRRLAALTVAVAVPAFAAPSDWQPSAFGDTGFAGEAHAQAVPMAFETAGESFPGSAFYYLADDGMASGTAQAAGPGQPLDAGAHWDNEDPAPIPAARPLLASGSPGDEARALQCLSMAVYYEAASESDAGQRAVAQVVLNRVAHPAYPNTVCGVVFQGSERRTGCQFTFTCDGSLARAPSRSGWARARAVARAALAGDVYAPVGLATHYHTIQVHPYWAASLRRLTSIGAHIFYSWRGAAGRPAAFTSAYLGSEPAAAAHARSVVDPAAALAPDALAKAYEAGLQRAAAIQAAQPRPDYTATVREQGGEALYSGARLPQGGGVKAEFVRSGEWIGAPR